MSAKLWACRTAILGGHSPGRDGTRLRCCGPSERSAWPQAMTAVGCPNAARRGHDGADAVPMHQAFDPATAGATSLCPQRGMDPWAAIASAAALMNLSDISQERSIGGRACAIRTLAPGVIAGRRDLEHAAHQPYRVESRWSSMKRKLMTGFRQRSRSTS